MPEVRIGISGWRYTPWRGDFYPDGLVQRRELEFASRAVNSIEINGSFYSLQTPERYMRWAADTPKDFVFSLKGPRYVTHTRRLKDIHEPLANFFASGFLAMRRKLGPILWQFPANFRYDRELFDDFLSRLPRDTDQAVKLARDCAERLKKPGYLEADPGQRLRHALEVRSETFVTEDFVELLRKHEIALVVADTAGKWPYAEDLTADFVYIRLHGDKELYTSGYDDEALDRWQQRIQTWSNGRQVRDARLIGTSQGPARKERDIFCYFDNDVKVRAPYDARTLLGKLGLDKDLQTSPGVPYEEEKSPGAKK